eukprot:CAMPEP_0178790284 /NCGR_PEP_ID=MMETSP0745-20121128/7353_1 /TAXON_ID=913974 /ORGANISM="Nitzschia punctata, Strain CCMP561" /LENGTH=129 /DNA_ID=CAMNT_0020448285 /DNA_START=1 /DNA_END=387 /DNA_ORIENTATION=-
MISPGNHHASLSKTEEAIDFLLNASGSLDKISYKILLGIPAYARHVKDPSKVRTFAEIYTDAVEEGKHTNIDWFNLNSWKGYEWDSPARIQEKIALARAKGLGGIFFWEIGQDKCTDNHPGGILLETAG